MGPTWPLIHNASGGLGLAPDDMARHVGATIFGTAGLRKHEFLSSRGVPALAPHIQLLLVHPKIARAATANTSRGMADGRLVPVEIPARKLR